MADFHHRSLRRRVGGFAYLILLGFVAVAGIALAALAQVWSTAAQREREAELLFIGHQFRAAIGSYYEQSPGAKQYPRSLEELLADPRFPQAKRHLRRLYVDPMTGKSEWGLVRHQDWVIGVHSLSEARPLKTALFEPEDAAFVDSGTYADWRFVFKPAESQSAAQAAATRAGDAKLPTMSPTGEEVLQTTPTGPAPGSIRPGAVESR
jgi:type II secretory pathway pseudopilin PulG